MDCTIGSPVVCNGVIMESTTGSTMESTIGALVESTTGPLVESTVDYIVKSREGSSVDSTTSLLWIVRRFPHWAHNGRYCWLYISLHWTVQ
eukprot:4736837-Lingulodinium_polyedra.AAC.1